MKRIQLARKVREKPKESEEKKEDDPSDEYFQEGEKYIMLDLGGGTADIACHEVVSGYHVKEIVPPSGGPWGSTYIDLEFEKLLDKVFTKVWMDEFKENWPNQWINLMSNFVGAKCLFYQNVQFGKKKAKVPEYHRVELPSNFLDFMGDKDDDWETTIVEAYREKGSDREG